MHPVQAIWFQFDSNSIPNKSPVLQYYSCSVGYTSIETTTCSPRFKYKTQNTRTWLQGLVQHKKYSMYSSKDSLKSWDLMLMRSDDKSWCCNQDCRVKTELKTLLTKAELRVILNLIVLSLRQTASYIYRRESWMTKQHSGSVSNCSSMSQRNIPEVPSQKSMMNQMINQKENE